MNPQSTVRINNSDYSCVEDLGPGVFTDKYLYSNSTDALMLIKKPSSPFHEIISKYDEQTLGLVIRSHSDGSIYNYSNYLNLIQPGDIQNPQNQFYLFASEYGKFSLNFLLLTKKVKFDNNVIKFYFKELLKIVERLCEKKIFYYALKMDDIFFDSKYSLKLEEYAIGHLVQKQTDLYTWVNKINLKSGTLAPELLKSHQEVLAHEEKTVIYNLGYILFSLVVGNQPFQKIDDEYYRMLVNKNQKDYWKVFDRGSKLDTDFKSLVFSMLSESPFDRPSFGQIWSNTWLSNLSISESYIEDYMKKLEQSFNKSLKKTSNNSIRVNRQETSPISINSNILDGLSSVLSLKESVKNTNNLILPQISHISEASLSKNDESKEAILDLVAYKSDKVAEKEKDDQKTTHNEVSEVLEDKLTISRNKRGELEENRLIEDFAEGLNINFNETLNQNFDGYETSEDSNGNRKLDFNLVFKESIDDAVNYFKNYFLSLKCNILYISDNLDKNKSMLMTYNHSLFEIRLKEKLNYDETCIIAEFINHSFSSSEFEKLFNDFSTDL